MIKKMKKLNALVIGAGKIGATLDDLEREDVLTHAHGYVKHEGFALAGFVDIKKDRSEKAARVWGGKAYDNLEEAFKNDDIDVVSLCTPEDDHYKTLEELKQYSFKGGILEKALTDDINTAKKIADDPFFMENPFPVNYMRRFVPEFQALRDTLAKGTYGKFITGTMYYGKGILRNGSHLIDLARFLGFEFTDFKTFGQTDDYYDWDLSYDTILEVKDSGYIAMQVIPAQLYRAIELDLFFEKGRVRILDSGFAIEEYEVIEDPVFEGYKTLQLKGQRQTQLGQYMYYVADNLYRAVTEGVEPMCTVKDAYIAQEISNDIATRESTLT